MTARITLIEFMHDICSTIAAAETWKFIIAGRPEAAKKATWVVAYDRYKDGMMARCMEGWDD